MGAKIGIFGEFTSNNLGDQLIGVGMRRLFTELGCTVNLYPLGSIITHSQKVPENRAVNLFRRAHRKSFQANKTYRHIVELLLFLTRKRKHQQASQDILGDMDILVFGGGQLLGDNSLRMLLKIDLLIREANKRKLQCAFFSVGVDYPGTIISRFFLTRIFKCLPAEHIYVRDITSNTVYAHINKKNRKTARVVSDAAFYAYDTSSSVHADQLIVGMAPQSYRTLSKKIKREHLHDNRWWCELTKQLIHLGAQPILFSNGVQSDHDRCEKIHYDLIQEGVHISLLPKPETTDQLREQLMGMSSILVQRLHLSIAYFALGGNPASLGWHSKVEDFYSSMGLKDRFLGEEKTSVVIVAKLLCDKAEKPPMQIAKLRQNLRENAESLMRTISRSTISTHNG